MSTYTKMSREGLSVGILSYTRILKPAWLSGFGPD